MDGTSIQNEVILGVDTHLDTHVGVVINHHGKVIGTLASIPTNEVGYLRLLTWVRSLGNFRRASVEGTGTYGAGLAWLLREQGIEVWEIYRPDRAKRRLRGKSIQLMLKVQHERFFLVTQRQRQSYNQVWLRHCVRY